jgi:hypothetical protein
MVRQTGLHFPPLGDGHHRGATWSHVGISASYQLQDLVLKAESIHIAHPNASLEVGTPEKPFQHRATLELGADPHPWGVTTAAEQSPGGLSVREGRLSMHGSPQLPAWTHLARTASEGDTTLLLSEVVNWQVIPSWAQ